MSSSSPRSAVVLGSPVHTAAAGGTEVAAATPVLAVQRSPEVFFGEDVATGQLIAGVLALALAAATVSCVVAFVYRWYSGQSAPDGVPILLGLSVIALWLNTTDILQQSLSDGGVVADDTAVATVVAFVVGTIGADAGRRFGEHVGADLPSVQSVRSIDADVGQLVRSVGRVTRVTVPEHVEDIDGYEPVPNDVKAELAGATFLFPRGLTVAELRERFADRLERDYDVGHVDVEVTAEGTVEYLALGRRLAGIGQTLHPNSVAVAVRADPAFTATAGDRVQVWRDDGDEPRRVVTGELRAAVGDVVTLVVAERDARALRDDIRYRLVTLPAEAQHDREFASLLRSADETMATVEVAPGSELVGATAGEVDLVVAAVEVDDRLETIPAAERTFAAGDRLYVLGRLDAIRRLESRAVAEAAGATDGATSGADAS